jgi:photosystem II stability/assembly factor-like uncharacterized protein
LPLALAAAGCGSSSSSASPTSTPASSASNAAITGTQNHVHSIVIMPSNPAAILMGAHYNLYESNNGGKTWSALTHQMMLSLSLDTSHPSTLYAVSLQNGLVKSTNGGKHWRQLSAVPKGQVTGVVWNPASGTILAYGNGVYRSTDGGVHWSRSLKGQSITSVSCGMGAVYAATGNGLYVSHDDGLKWISAASIGPQPIIQVGATKNVAYAVTPVALMKSSNSGHSWTTLNKAPSGMNFLGVAPTNPNEVVADVSLSSGGSSFYVTDDGGKTWHKSAGIHGQSFTSSTVRVAPSSPNVMYTGAWGLYFFASHDGGKHWVLTATLKK